MKRGYSIIFVVVVLILAYTYIYRPYEYNLNHPNCDTDIYNKAKEIENGRNNKTAIVMNISYWVIGNIPWTNTSYCKKQFSDCETFYKKCGMCGEQADLISTMLNSLGIEAHSLTNVPWGDHQWNEAKINGEWVFFDGTQFSKEEFLKKYGKDLFIVWGVSSNGIPFDATFRYVSLSEFITKFKNMYGLSFLFAMYPIFL